VSLQEIVLKAVGRAFQASGPAVEKAQLPNFVLVRNLT